MDEPTSKPNAFIDFFSRPIVGIAGSITSIIGLALSIYFFAVSREAPELTYFVHPAKAAVVRTGQMSRLSVQFDGQTLTGDITAAQIAFWNAGRKSIRAENVLRPLVLKTGDKTKILEARIQKSSRDVVGLELDSSRLALGEVQIKWNILEQNDGGVIQIVYVSDESIPLEAHAVLEGQPEIVRLEYSRSLSTPNEEYLRRQGGMHRISAYILVCLGPLNLVFALWFYSRRRQRDKRANRKTSWETSDWFSLILSVAIFGMGIWNFYYEIPPGPPFGF
jgi:hypothetical protein